MVDGWNAVHGGEPEPEPMSDSEFDEMVERAAGQRALEL